MVKNKQESGFAALMSAIIISLILLAVVFALGTDGYFARVNSSNIEYKRVSFGLAESCANAALLRIAKNYSYAPPGGGEAVAVGSQSCTIKSVTYIPDSAHRQEQATIVATANFNNAFTNFIVQAVVQDTSQPPLAPPPNISISGWREIP